VVRLEQIADLADRFIRVRLNRIDELDLVVFDFDYDVTFAILFLSPDGQVYGRYGGRDTKGPDARQSLSGLRYTMASVLEMHGRAVKEFAPRTPDRPSYIQNVPGGQRYGRCLHCHQVREILNDNRKRTGQWQRDDAFRFPLPDRLGFTLEVNRGNVVATVQPESAAARTGLSTGARLCRLNGVPVHSEADVQFALDRAPARGSITVTWEQRGATNHGSLALSTGWRQHDITWRPSMQMFIPYLPLYGQDLTAREKLLLGLPEEVMAFRQRAELHSSAQAAGIQAGDVVCAVDGRTFTTIDECRAAISREYLVGDRVRVDVWRDGKHLSLPLTLP
jgi:serine protease Do